MLLVATKQHLSPSGHKRNAMEYSTKYTHNKPYN